jgi:mono/diheme cytochrome c family protein
MNGTAGLIAAVMLGMVASGCAHHATAGTAASGAGPAAVAAGDTTRGRALFVAQCAACHDVTGVEGGVGPSLKNERKRKSHAQVVASIEHPQPPMPKLYPAPLSDADVEDLVRYIQSL